MFVRVRRKGGRSVDWRDSKLLAALAASGLPEASMMHRLSRTPPSGAAIAPSGKYRLWSWTTLEIAAQQDCFALDFSHGYEWTHISSLVALSRLLDLYMQSKPLFGRDTDTLGLPGDLPSAEAG